ncbi:MAG: ATP-binding protein [bacterium]
MPAKPNKPTVPANRENPKPRILVVDDDPATVQILEQALSFKGFFVRTATSGPEALKIFQEEGEFEVVVTDLILPEMTGIELMEQFKQINPACEVLVLTGFGSVERAVEALRKGAFDYLKKPTNLEELTISVSKAIEHKKLTQENIVYQNDLERLVAERSAELLKTQKFLHSVLESSQEHFIIATDPQGLITLFNSGAEKLFSYNRSEVEGKRPIFFFSSEGANSEPTDVDRFLKIIRAEQNHQIINRKGKSITISLTVSPILDENSQMIGYIWIGRDVTEQLRLQRELQGYTQNLEKMVAERTQELQSRNQELEKTFEELKNTQMQLLQSEKMASLGQLAAGVAHEINNPIGYVNSNLSTLKKYLANITEYCQFVDRVLEGGEAEAIEELRVFKKNKKVDFILDDICAVVVESLEGVDRVKTIILDLKDFSHQDRGNVEEYDLNKGIQSTLNIVWNELKYKAEVVQDLGNIPPIRCYPQQLNQVFMNLLVNAAHAIPQKGNIRISSCATAEEVIVEVNDNGVGIPLENLSRIFEPFFTTKEVGEGTGLGLSLSYQIVSRHAGKIEVESQVGEGTTFRVRLPISGPPIGVDQPLPRPESVVALQD